MAGPGLIGISPDLVDILAHSPEGVRRGIVERACNLAVDRASVADPKIAAALETIARQEVSMSPLKAEVDSVTKELGEAAWDIQERVEVREAVERDYLQAFAKARAAAAVGYALDGSLASSFDSLYEAYHAINDRDDFMRVVSIDQNKG